jgi:hypothetical protein
MTYEIKQREDGRFAVVEAVPVEIALFGSETHARMFVRRVLEGEMPAPRRDLGGIEPAEARFDPMASIHHLARAAAADFAANGSALLSGLRPPPDSTPPPAADEAAAPGAEDVCDAEPQSPGGFTADLKQQSGCGAGAFEDDPWEAALARVAAGEGCKAVAEEMGLSFTSLRARWAGRKSAGKASGVQEDAPSAPVDVLLPVPVRATQLQVRRAPGDSLSLPEEREDVRGRPDLVARREAIWTDEIDMELIEAVDDEAKVWEIANRMDATLERVKRRQTALLEGIAKEIGR